MSAVRCGSLALALLLLGGCGDATGGGDGTAGGGGLETGDQAGGQTGPPVAGCSAAPGLPTDIPTFEPLQAPAEPSGPTLQAVLETSCGALTLELDGDAAPRTVASFEFLAAQGYWEASPCHRLTTQGIFVLQCGDPTGTGRGGPGYTFGLENAPADGRYPRGTVAMARSADPDSNGGQFFVVHQDTVLPTEGGGYTVFGRVTGGMEIIDRIAAQGVDGGGADGMPAQPVSILSVAVTEEEAAAS